MQLILDHGYLIIFLAVLIDTFPGGGFLIPEEMIIALAGFYAAQGKLNVAIVYLLASVGLFTGQILLFFLSKKHGQKLLKMLRMDDRKQQILHKYLIQNGWWVNIAFRLTSTMRSAVAVISALGNYKFSTFLKYELALALLKPLIYLGIGYFIGQTVEQVQSIVGQVVLFFLIFGIGSGIVSVIISRKIFRDDRNDS